MGRKTSTPSQALAESSSSGLCLVLLGGALKVEVSSGLAAQLANAIVRQPVPPGQSAAPYDVASPDLPMSRRRFRRGCREGWWPSWSGRNGRLMASRPDVDTWLRDHRAVKGDPHQGPDADEVEQILVESGLRPRPR